MDNRWPVLKSIEKNKKGFLLMIISSFCACVGQLLWKLSVTHGITVMLFGFLFYGIGALCMIVAYKYGKLSVLQPILSLNYALGILLGFVFLGEPITALKGAGVIIIMFGVVCIAGGDEE